MKRIKVIMCEPDKQAYVTEIDKSLECYHELVGGYIECVYPYSDNIAIVCNDEGKINGLPQNRVLFSEDGVPYDVLCGTFFITGIGSEDFKSLTKKQTDKFLEMFRYPSCFKPDTYYNMRVSINRNAPEG